MEKIVIVHGYDAFDLQQKANMYAERGYMPHGSITTGEGSSLFLVMILDF